jgi:hypothetical protein
MRGTAAEDPGCRRVAAAVIGTYVLYFGAWRSPVRATAGLHSGWLRGSAVTFTPIFMFRASQPHRLSADSLR